jgi:hypothetical protein
MHGRVSTFIAFKKGDRFRQSRLDAIWRFSYDGIHLFHEKKS